MRFSLILSGILGLLSANLGWGAFLEGLPSPTDNLHTSGAFIGPNELEPQKALPIWSQAPAGVYVAVGSERGFIGAACSPRVTHLLLIDYDLGVVRFNRINIALLEMAKSREDYLWLRLQAGLSDWQERLVLVEPGLQPEVRSEGFAFFRHEITSHEFNPFQNADLAKNERAFDGANYLFDDTEFNHLWKLAQARTIESIPLDLRSSAGVRAVEAAISRAGLAISVFDMSNVWWEVYVNELELAEFLADFAQVSQRDGILLPTDDLTFTSQRAGPLYSIPWGYYGELLASFRDRPTLLRFVRNLRSRPLRLVEGTVQKPNF